MRRIAVDPADRFRVLVIAGDVASDLACEVGERGENASGEQVPFDFGKPEFDLVEPRGIRRREVQLDAGIRVEKRLDLFGLVRREVADNHVDRMPTWLRREDVAEKGDERVAGVPRHRLSDDFTRARVEPSADV